MMIACYKWHRENKFLVIFLQLSVILKIFLKIEKKKKIPMKITPEIKSQASHYFL